MSEESTGHNPAYAKYDGMPLTALGACMEDVRIKLDAAKDAAKELEKEYEFLRTVKIPPAMEAEGLANFRLASGKGIRVQDEVFVSMRGDNLPEMEEWLQEQGDEAIIRKTINASTLKSYIVGRIKDGKEYPLELVSVNIIPKARFF